jgi:hypothetical protein
MYRKLKLTPKVIFFLLILNVCFLIYTTKLVSAETMSNNLFRITWGNFNMAAGKPTNASYKVSYTAGQLAPGLYTGTNFKIRAGFQYIYSIIPFAFSIDNIYVDFGTLTPANPVTRTSTLAVSNQSSSGYVVTAFENHQLLYPAAGQVIPDTTCDAGTCSETTAAAWTSSLTYGFGYRCDIVTGINYCNTDFSTATFYKQFADESKTETGQMVFSSLNSGRNQQAKVTYKANISSVQAAGAYSNAITYIATPTF